MGWKPFYQENEEIITFVYPEPKKPWKVISTSLLGRNENEEWETLVADGEKGSVEGVDLELLGFNPEKGEITFKSILPTIVKKVDKDASIFTQHFNDILKKWGSDIECVSGWKKPIIVCSPIIPKVDKKLKKAEDYWKFRKEVIDEFERRLEREVL